MRLWHGEGQPGTVGRVGVKSAEGYTPAWLTYNLAPHAPGWLKSTNGRPVTNPAEIPVAQKTLRDSALWGFLLYGADNQFNDYATSTGDISRPYSR